MSDVVLYEKIGTFLSDSENIAQITLNRPEALNTFSADLMEGVMAALDKAEADKDVRVVIITGSGEKAFSAGADVKSMTTSTPEEMGKFILRGQEVFRRIESFAKPTIAALNGLTLGGGLEIAMACDIRIAHEEVKVGAPEVKLGLIPAWGGTQRLGYLVGMSKAREMVLTGGMYSAKEAEAMGLISKIVPKDELAATAGFMATQIADNAPLALDAAKKAMNASRTMSILDGNNYEAQLFADLAKSKDLEEGVTALLAKRKPKFTGE
ncbi:MAG: enoyl-CoA hydratase/isomerase family protein [Candidatus Heimdallarchaeota archaeon]|nr:enoyl-CoA hydratase/isomerase family protein [Candidatus Heimdallarchaeota archaeon]